MLLSECCLYVPLKTASIVISSLGLICSLGLLGSCFLFVDTSLQLNLPPIVGLLITNIFLVYSTKKEIHMLILPCLVMQIMLSTFLWYVKYSRYVVDFLTASFHIMVFVLLAYVWFIVYCYYHELKHREIPKTYIEFEPVELRGADNIDDDKECDTSLLV